MSFGSKTYPKANGRLMICFRSLLFGVGLGCLGASLQAAEWQVPRDYPNLQSAVNGVASGDTILVAPGTYVGGINFNAKNITLISLQGPAATIIDANGTVGVTIGPLGKLIGFTITNAYGTFGAGMVVNGNGSLIKSNIFDGNRQATGGFGAGIGGNGASPTIEQNIFRRHMADDQWGSGVVCFVNTSAPKIVNNIFESNACRGINLAVFEQNNPEVVNNTLVGNSVGIRYSRMVNATAWLFRNNLIYGNGVGLQVDFNTDSWNAIWQNNLVYSNTTDYVGVVNQTGRNGNLSAPPMFYDDKGDYHLRRGSPAIDAGFTSGTPSVDFDGQARPRDGNGDGSAIADIGAYEFIPGPPRAPQKMFGLSGNGQITLSWLESVDATGYHLKRSSQSGGPFEVIQSLIQTNYLDTNVVNNEVYYYVVSALNDWGESANSAELQVQAGNLPPNAVDDLVTIQEDTEIEIAVLANDTDPNADPLTLVSVTQPGNGSIATNLGVSVKFMPAPNFNGTNQFNYVITDGRGAYATGMVTIVVTPVNDLPLAVSKSWSLQGDQGGTFTLLGSDVDGDALSFSLLSLPTNGIITDFDPALGRFSYLPEHGFSGFDAFTFVTFDGELASSPGLAYLQVAKPRDSDYDGMPDYWETLHDINNWNDDRDFDGHPNYEEYRANTNPRDVTSVLRISSVFRDAQGHLVLIWNSIGGTRYRVQTSNGATNGSWNGVFTDIVRSAAEETDPAPIGESAQRVWIDMTTNNAQFYRIRVVP